MHNEWDINGSTVGPIWAIQFSSLVPHWAQDNLHIEVGPQSFSAPGKRSLSALCSRQVAPCAWRQQSPAETLKQQVMRSRLEHIHSTGGLHCPNGTVSPLSVR